MWRARPLSDTAPPKAGPLTHGEARGSVTWTNAVDDEKDAKKLDKAVEASQKPATEEVAAAKAVA